jgi:cell division septation protein DedD
MRMAAREDGEFELILGNKQLLSVLFIVIVLLGVFFAMGFLAGRTTSPPPTAMAKSGAGPLMVEPGTKDIGPAGKALAPGDVSVGQETRSEPVRPEPAPTRAPAIATPAPTPAPKPTGTALPVSAAPAAAKAPAAAPAPAPAASGTGYVETPPKGTYLQVAATSRADAENMLGLLSKKGLHGYATPSPKNPQLVRVILGPMPDGDAMAAARKKLSDEGVASPVVVKY